MPTKFLVVLPLVIALHSPATGAEVDFERDIAPVLVRHCVECHGGADASGKLDLTTAKGILDGGKEGPALVPGKAAESHFLNRIRSDEMPPKKSGKSQKLPAVEIELLAKWVDEGAKWPQGRTLDLYERTTTVRAGRDWWSLQPLAKPAIPKSSGGNNPVDAFVIRDLAAKGLQLGPSADKRTLIRRLYFNLLGLPPSPEEVDSFVADQSPVAYEMLVERLLASPHFGERWARHWLDVARYAETCGYERDQVKPFVWKYRDWVVKAFNDNMPFDRFAIEQLAGDEIANRSESSLIATGFLRLGTWNDEPNDANEYKYDRLEDMVHATSTAFLGLTIKCARCHDHKFDPIKQTDYYRVGGAFWAGYIEPGGGDVLGGPDAKKFAADVFAWTDRSKTPPPLHLLKKGDPKRIGPAVEPAHLSFVPKLDKPFAPPPSEATTTQRRLQLAKWIVDPANPLTPRVWVNRLWHHHFGKGLVKSVDNFGFNGDKPTHPELLDWLAGELIRTGWDSKAIHRMLVLSQTYRQAASHPQEEACSKVDPDNRLWWRAERRRLDAESLRDALLAASGRLDAARMGGPSFAPTIGADALEGLSMKSNAWKASPPDLQRRRSLYMFSKRGLLPPLATVFDFPDTTLPCGQRDVTTVAPQALALLNNDFIHEQSEAMARRILRGGGTETERIAAAWRKAFARQPSASEVKFATEHVTEQKRLFARKPLAPTAERTPEFLAWASLCHVLLNTNEFAYVD